MDRDKVLSLIRERMVAFATSRLSGEGAEDLAQEVLVLLHEKYPHVTELTELVPLSFQILRYKMLESHRKAKRRREYDQIDIDDPPLADPGVDPETEIDRKRRVERLVAAMGQLGERCRELFRLKLQGKTFPEIKEIMGETSINTIYTWDHRCRKQLKDLLDGSYE